MLRANIELALSSDESDDDITAALTAPRPTNDTSGGVRYCSTMGSTNDWWSLSSGNGPAKSVSFHANLQNISYN